MPYENSAPAILRAIAADLDQMVDGGICYTGLAGHADKLRELHVRLERLLARCDHELIRERVVAVRGCLDFLEALIDASRASGPSIALLASILECQANEMSNNVTAIIATAANVTRLRPHVSNGPFGGDAA